MKKATISSLRNNLSRYLAYVRRGGRVLVFKRDAPIAEIVPVRPPQSTDPAVEAHLERLEREGILARGTRAVAPELMVPLEGEPQGAVDALLDERAAGR